MDVRPSGRRGPDPTSAGLDRALISAPSEMPPRSVSQVRGSDLARWNRLLALPDLSALSYSPSRSESFLVGSERVLPITNVPLRVTTRCLIV